MMQFNQDFPQRRKGAKRTWIQGVLSFLCAFALCGSTYFQTAPVPAGR